MAEKDTPEDAGETFREARPLPEGPRSEGVPAAPPDTLLAAEAQAPGEPLDQPPIEAREAGLPQSEAEPEPDLSPPEPAASPRTDAVERAFAEERAVPDVPADVAPPDEPKPFTAGLTVDAAPETDAPAQDEKPADTTPTDTAASTSAAADDNSASFTSAVEGLFRPSEASSDDTHLITTGRRFNPSLSVPAPAPQTAGHEADPPSTSTANRWKRHLWTGARYIAYAVAGYLALVVLLIILFRFVNPPGSMLMLSKLLGGTAIDRTWVPFEAISPALARSVIVSEDSRFCAHRGIDMQAMRLALEEASRGSPRGASTISMQVTKNLFLWNAKSYLRKVVELPLTLVMEAVWPKKRILEVYLNIAEWGPGVFGAEAAARHHFDKPASKLTEREAALLAAALPNPAIRVASNPGPRTSRMARVIQARVRAFGSVAQCVVTAPPPAPPAAAKPKTPPKTAPARKPPAAKKPPQKQESQDWAPTLRFGP
ncbi:monofunctional biosynthetic peptidoglycan transglycosylase [Hyphomicrobium nitrativorans]|uniref:monofunctional biosynthetic peptidoglycan transglycosylase n=1 Tax=Hyphomicrobium nitrativorans TaxID=1427356 RepID=UPI001FCAE023|nr:monofunctional biosynthetic peptidoglycan transglycosylase [Hyphomicrobium nitrativorans]